VVNTWDSAKSRCVQRVPTQRELEDHTLSYEQIAASDGQPLRKSLIFSAIRSGNVELMKVLTWQPVLANNILAVSTIGLRKSCNDYTTLLTRFF